MKNVSGIGNLKKFEEHAQTLRGEEACAIFADGLEICHNAHYQKQKHFQIPRERVKQAKGKIKAILHSHPDGGPPSLADRAACEESGVPWGVYSVPDGVWHWIEPDGTRVPYIGRPYAFGVFDCWTLVRDWYRWELGIDVVAPEYAWDFWSRNEDPYGQNYAAAGFERVPSPQPGDIIVMGAGSLLPSHGGIYLPGNLLLHHRPGRLSVAEPYTGFWRKTTCYFLRYRNVENR